MHPDKVKDWYQLEDFYTWKEQIDEVLLQECPPEFKEETWQERDSSWDKYIWRSQETEEVPVPKKRKKRKKKVVKKEVKVQSPKDMEDCLEI